MQQTAKELNQQLRYVHEAMDALQKLKEQLKRAVYLAERPTGFQVGDEVRFINQTCAAEVACNTLGKVVHVDGDRYTVRWASGSIPVCTVDLDEIHYADYNMYKTCEEA